MTESPSKTTASRIAAQDFIAQEIDLQLRIIERMFGHEFPQLMRKSPNHPAVKRYQLLEAAKQHSENETEALREVCTMLIDRSSWAIIPTGADYWQFLSDPLVKAHVERRIKDERLYDDTLAEVYFWGLLQREGFNSELVQIDGLPDIVLERDTQDENWVEVKRFRAGKNPKRARNVIKHANSQIKRVGDNSLGMVLIALEREHITDDDSTGPPNDVLPFIDEIERELYSGHSRRVAQVILSWDSFSTTVEAGRILFSLARKSITLQHDSPLRPSAFSDLSAGTTIQISRRNLDAGRTPLLVKDDIKVTDSFLRDNNFGDGVRREHALVALADPDVMYEQELGEGINSILATARIVSSKAPYVLLLLAIRTIEGVIELSNAYRLYPSEQDPEDVLSHPPSALFTLLRRYGCLADLNGKEDLYFIPRLDVRMGEQYPFRYAVTGGEQYTFHQFLRLDDKDQGLVHCKWLFAISLTRYKAAIAQRRA
jgi:hypothetical protein